MPENFMDLITHMCLLFNYFLVVVNRTQFITSIYTIQLCFLPLTIADNFVDIQKASYIHKKSFCGLLLSLAKILSDFTVIKAKKLQDNVKNSFSAKYMCTRIPTVFSTGRT